MCAGIIQSVVGCASIQSSVFKNVWKHDLLKGMRLCPIIAQDYARVARCPGLKATEEGTFPSADPLKSSYLKGTNKYSNEKWRRK